ncbi:phage tail tape measure protein, partial [bacterium]|nr:phage tail tape measure protein [bacterium]
MSRFSIEAVFTAIDHITKPVANMARNSKMLAASIEQSSLKMSAGLQRARESTAMLGTAALGGLAIGLGLVTRQYFAFDQSITSASAKFTDLNRNTVDGQQKLEALRQIARKLGAETEFSADQAAQGLDFLAMAGFKTEQAISLLPGVVNLATVANVDLARATDIASDALGAFGLNTSDSTQLAINFTRINDVMAATMTRSNTSMEDLFESIKKGGASFVTAGQSVESFNALAGIMANSGLKGEESGTQLRNIMLRLADPTAEAAAQLKKLGVVTQDQNGNFLDIVDIIASLETGLNGMGTAQRSAALAQIFGARSVTGMNILLKEGSSNIRNFRTGLEGSAGASERMADVMRSSLMNQLKG